jgi:hypothetical protein
LNSGQRDAPAARRFPAYISANSIGVRIPKIK